MTLVTHNDIFIASPPEHVWPHIVEVNRWKKGLTLHRVLSSASGDGDLYKAVVSGSQTALYYVLDVELVAPERRTIKLAHGKDDAAFGFASWGLRGRDGGTEVTYDFYAEPPRQSEIEPSIPEQIAALKGRFQDELLSLKQLVEQGPE